MNWRSPEEKPEDFYTAVAIHATVGAVFGYLRRATDRFHTFPDGEWVQWDHIEAWCYPSDLIADYEAGRPVEF